MTIASVRGDGSPAFTFVVKAHGIEINQWWGNRVGRVNKIQPRSGAII
ncbi:MAG TPA: hypothetical protein VH350_05035 [Candidatus Sulfotelmatobacter sp.]|nr:hypothetical protein [Candidatus Sulfotelmatobacter sp.]